MLLRFTLPIPTLLSFSLLQRLVRFVLLLTPVPDQKIVEAVLSGQLLCGVIPYYNFITGFIRETVSLLLSTTVHVSGQLNVPVDLNLVSNSPLNKIQTVCRYAL